MKKILNSKFAKVLGLVAAVITVFAAVKPMMAKMKKSDENDA